MVKNLIAGVIVSVCLFFAGCSSKSTELVELNRANAQNIAASSENVVTVETTHVNSDISAGEALSQPVVVYICGSVRNPGVYELKGGSRIFDAVETAGGFTADAYEKNLNLAKVITDEQMIYIMSTDEAAEALNGADDGTGGLSYADTGIYGIGSDNGSGNNSNTDQTLVNINTATAEQLTSIPGIGASKAEKIIAYRTENGRFNSPEDIMNISGIKEGMYNKIKDYICVR